MAREKAERGEALTSGSNTRKKLGKGNSTFGDDDDDNFGNRMGDIGANEQPEPEVLLSILHRKTKKY
jgi:hypothetical protein